MPTVVINGKKHTPGSNTLKKLKRKAAAEAAKKGNTPKGSAPKKTETKSKPPIPKDRPKKGKEPVKGIDLPSTARANASVASQKLKNGKPPKREGKKKGHGIAMGGYRLK